MPLKAGREDLNIGDALQEMLRKVGSDRLDEPLFYCSDERFKNIHRTTWELLASKKRWIEELNAGEYRFRPEGWVEALRKTGKLCDANSKELLGTLCAFMKARCESGSGRHEDATTVDEITTETSLSEAFVYNAVDAQLIRVCFGLEDARWDPLDLNKYQIIIPARFGMKAQR